MTLIHTKIIPDAKRDHVEQKTDTSYIVEVKDPAENNQANRKLIRLLAQHFAIPLSRIRIITGHKQPSKIIEIIEIDS